MRLLLILLLVLVAPLSSLSARSWTVTSPDHDQTFAYGSEQSHRGWIITSNGTLAVVLSFTNDPYVDRVTPRMYNTFTLDFPSIRLGSDRETFYYRAPNGKLIPVAEIHPSIFGLRYVHLRPTSDLIVDSDRGFVTATLLVGIDPNAPKSGHFDAAGGTP